MDRRGLAWLGLAAAAVLGGCKGVNTTGPGAPTPPATAIITPAIPNAATVSFEVHSDQSRSPISSLIYGINSGDFTDPSIQHLTFNRAGGNRMTAYNWETNASNAGEDYLNQNDNYLGTSTAPVGVFTPMIQNTLAAGGSFLMTVPMAGYVAADENGGGDVNQTPDYIDVRFNVSSPRKGAPFSISPNLTDHHVYQDEFANFLKLAYPAAFSGAGPQISFQLDNEPDLWATTHPRIRGDAVGASGTPVTYAELFQRTEDYASALKDVAPNALIYGPVSYGWEGYVTLQGAPDANGRDFIDAYLTEMQRYANANGRRIVDVLDLHWYPEARSTTNVRITAADDTAPVVAARVQAPRSLYDPTYVENSWISQNVGAIDLIPRMMTKIATYYPGTKLSFSEYDYGGGANISGGVAEADALGIFGVQGVYSANYWPETTIHSFTLGGFAMFRNFDLNGAAFGDTSIKATTTDGVNTAIYASVDSTNPGRMVIVMINRSNAAVTTATRIWHTQALTQAHAYQMSGVNSTPQDLGVVPINGDSLSMTLPAYSVTTIQLKS